MKKRLYTAAVFSMAFIFTGSSIAYVAAQETTAEDSTQLKQRIEERKTRLQTRLDNNQFKRLTDRCSGVQGKLGSLVTRFENSDNPYRVKYDNYLQRLEKLQTRLKENNVDTTKLDAEIVVLKQKIATLKSSVDTFVQAVNDAKAVDCKNDPTGFRAALDDAKNAGVALKAARADLEKYARETIKATIEEIKAQRKASSEQTEQDAR